MSDTPDVLAPLEMPEVIPFSTFREVWAERNALCALLLEWEAGCNEYGGLLITPEQHDVLRYAAGQARARIRAIREGA